MIDNLYFLGLIIFGVTFVMTTFIVGVFIVVFNSITVLSKDV